MYQGNVYFSLDLYSTVMLFATNQCCFHCAPYSDKLLAELTDFISQGVLRFSWDEGVPLQPRNPYQLLRFIQTSKGTLICDFSQNIGPLFTIWQAPEICVRFVKNGPSHIQRYFCSNGAHDQGLFLKKGADPLEFHIPACLNM